MHVQGLALFPSQQLNGHRNYDNAKNQVNYTRFKTILITSCFLFSIAIIPYHQPSLIITHHWLSKD